MYALRDLMGHCYMHFAFVFTLNKMSMACGVFAISEIRLRLHCKLSTLDISHLASLSIWGAVRRGFLPKLYGWNWD